MSDPNTRSAAIEDVTMWRVCLILMRSRRGPFAAARGAGVSMRGGPAAGGGAAVVIAVLSFLPSRCGSWLCQQDVSGGAHRHP